MANIKYPQKVLEVGINNQNWYAKVQKGEYTGILNISYNQLINYIKIVSYQYFPNDIDLLSQFIKTNNVIYFKHKSYIIEDIVAEAIAKSFLESAKMIGLLDQIYNESRLKRK